MGTWTIALLITLGLARGWTVSAGTFMKQEDPLLSSLLAPKKKLRGGIRVLQELREYAAASGHLDPKVDGTNADHGNNDPPVLDARYEGLHASNIPMMSPELDVLANSQGTAGMGPGAVVLGAKMDETEDAGGLDEIAGPEN